MVIGAIALDLLPGPPLVAMCVAGLLTLVAYVLTLRLLARHVIDDALGVLPVPTRYTDLASRLLGL